MSSNITFNGVTYSIPDDGDFNWGPDLTAYFIAIASGALQKTGGTFTLGAETDFGASFGLKSLYFKSRHANPAAAGQIRLGNTESISWRNNANGADLALSSNASDALIFNSKNVLFSALGLIVNADVNAAAAIAYSKLNLATSIVNADINAAAAIAYSKLNLATSIVNADIAAGANIAMTKLVALAASRAVMTDGSGNFTGATTTSTELNYVNGVTSAIQTQLDAKQARSTLTTKGDLYVATASATVARQAVGADDTTLFADSSQTNGMGYHTLINSTLLHNIGLACSVGSNALTIALKTAAGNNASATDPVKVAFRSATLATGTVSLVKVTGALSTVISSGSTAGHSNALERQIYVYLINNAGTAELAWSTKLFNENLLVSTTAEGGAGAADSATVMYSTTARSNVAFRCIGRLLSTQTTAGTWAAVPTNIQVGDVRKVTSGLEIRAIYETNAGNSVNAATVAITDFEDAVEDTHAAVTTGAAWKFTCPTGYGGTYLVCGATSLDSLATAKVMESRVYKNGTLYGVGTRGQTSLVDTIASSFSHLVRLAPTEYVDIRTFNGDASSRNYNVSAAFNRVSITRIGD